MTTVLAPIDLSPITTEVVAQAGNLARAFRGRVILFTVMLEPIFVKEYAPPPDLVRRVTVGNERAVRRQLAEFEKQLARQSVRSASIIVQGLGAARLILQQARKARANYIVLGSHGHTAFYDLIGGSTLHGVLKDARCPVVVIPAHAKRAKSR